MATRMTPTPAKQTNDDYHHLKFELRVISKKLQNSIIKSVVWNYVGNEF